MNFSEKLNILMDLTGTTNNKLAKALCVDSSLICRWRKNTRNPLKNHALIVAMGTFFSARLTMPHQKKILLDAMGVHRTNNMEDFSYHEAITYWINGKELNYLHDPNNFINSDICKSEKYLDEISSIIKMWLNLGGSPTLWIVLDEPPRKAYRSFSMFIKSMEQCGGQIKKANSIKIILRQDMNLSLAQKILHSATLNSNTMQNNLEFYFLSYFSSIYEHFSLLIEDIGCVIASSSIVEPDGIYTTCDKNVLKLLKTEYAKLAGQCSVSRPLSHQLNRNEFILNILNNQLTHVFDFTISENLHCLFNEFIAEKTTLDKTPVIDRTWLFNYKALFISNSEGVAQYTNEASKGLWDLYPSEIMGQSVFDMEKKGNFYPSITRLVLEKNKRISTLQTTKTGKTLFVFGFPNYNPKGELTHVINFTSDLS